MTQVLRFQVGQSDKRNGFQRGWRLCFVALSALALLTPCRMLSQQTTADVVGTVSDRTGAVVPGATVRLTSIDTGEAQTTQTTESGDFAFNLLKPGRTPSPLSQRVSGISRSESSDSLPAIAPVKTDTWMLALLRKL